MTKNKFDTKKLPHWYNGCLKTLISVFGLRFSSVLIKRESEKAQKSKTIIVPIEYGNRQNYLRLLDTGQGASIDASFPRIVFELTGFNPNNDRSDNEANVIKCLDENGNLTYVGAPIWWDVDISMYITSKNVDDGLQILEQIVPNFRPNESWKIRFLKQIPIIDRIEVVLNSGSLTDNWEGSLEDRRFNVWTLTFKATIPIYGKVYDNADDGQKVIWDSTANVSDTDSKTSYNYRYDPKTNEIIETITTGEDNGTKT